jgi:cytoskeleton protein RodZ
MSDHVETTPIGYHDPKEGFDRGEPNARSIWLFTILSIVSLVLVLVAVQQYFVKIWDEAVTEKVLTAPDSQLQMVRGRDTWDLTHYMYLDKKTGQVRIPVERATDLFLQEVADGKPFYPGKPTVPKKEEPAAAAPDAPATPGAASPVVAAPTTPAPAAAAPAPAPAPAKKAAKKK